MLFREAAWHGGSLLASHPAAPGSIQRKKYRCCRCLSMALVRGKWIVACKCWCNPSCGKPVLQKFTVFLWININLIGLFHLNRSTVFSLVTASLWPASTAPCPWGSTRPSATSSLSTRLTSTSFTSGRPTTSGSTIPTLRSVELRLTIVSST